MEKSSIEEETKNFLEYLEELAGHNKVGVYAANARVMRSEERGLLHREFSDQIQRGFYTELADFVKRGHIVAVLLPHVMVVDGVRTTEESFWMIDPETGTSFALPHHELISISSGKVEGYAAMFYIRISPREVLDPRSYGFRSAVLRLRNLIPRK